VSIIFRARFRPTHQGEILIHASRTFSETERLLLQQEPFKTVFARHGIKYSTDLPTGVPIALATIDKVLLAEEIINDLSDQERAFGDYRQGRYAWLLKDIVRRQRKGKWGTSGSGMVECRGPAL
jgi:hypothetical protein